MDSQPRHYLLVDRAAKVCSVGDAGVEDKVRRGIAQTKMILKYN